MRIAALMLEGPDRGKIFTSSATFLNIATVSRSFDLWTDKYYADETHNFSTIQFTVYKITLFGVVVPVWVPVHLRTEEEMNVWALHRLIDQNLHSGLTQVASTPPEWAKPPTRVHADRQREIEHHG